MAKKILKFVKIFLAVLLAVLVGIVLIVVPPMFMETLDNSWSLSSKKDNPPLMVAHRGLSSLAPENSLPAIEMAVEYGFDGYEIDIQTTKDGEWILLHDETVDAMTDGSGVVSEMTLEEIRALRLDGGNGAENYTDLKVPTLEEALEVCKESDIIPVIEIKWCDYERIPALLETIENYGLKDRAVLISFDSGSLEVCRELDKDIEILFIATHPTKADVDWCIEHNAGLNYCFGYLAPSFSAISYARENSVKLAVWTVDNIVFEDVVVLFGAEIITTNKILP